MKRFRIIIVVGAAVLLIGTIGWRISTVAARRPPRINQESFNEILVGMTVAEVEAIIGGPPGDYTYGRRMAFNHHAIAVTTWTGDEAEIQLRLDTRNVVTRKFLAPTRESFPTVRQFISGWLGI